ncbi:beta-microseminoprotein-like [Notamacropus eugenii]|uniref:beta-microseminoprotein-like n=1 Tax=Notamacropus eugenii TaxID=9315 RepID=UPI003B66E24E
MLGILPALAIFVTFCDADCTFRPLEIIAGVVPKGCKDGNGAFVEFGTQWESNCVRCTCYLGLGLNCCSTVIRPKNYDKVKCKEIFNKFTCSMYAVQKANPSLACEVNQYVG